MNWARGQPNNFRSREHHAKLRCDARWNDVNSEDPLQTVCMKPIRNSVVRGQPNCRYFFSSKSFRYTNYASPTILDDHAWAIKVAHRQERQQEERAKRRGATLQLYSSTILDEAWTPIATSLQQLEPVTQMVYVPCWSHYLHGLELAIAQNRGKTYQRSSLCWRTVQQ